MLLMFLGCITWVSSSNLVTKAEKFISSNFGKSVSGLYLRPGLEIKLGEIFFKQLLSGINTMLITEVKTLSFCNRLDLL